MCFIATERSSGLCVSKIEKKEEVLGDKFEERRLWGGMKLHALWGSSARGTEKETDSESIAKTRLGLGYKTGEKKKKNVVKPEE